MWLRALWEGRRTKHNAARKSNPAPVWVANMCDAHRRVPRLHVASARVCVWVIKESDCHIRRPTREGCGPVCCLPVPPQIALFLRLFPLGSPAPRHSAASLLSRVLRSPKPSHFQILPVTGSSDAAEFAATSSARITCASRINIADIGCPTCVSTGSLMRFRIVFDDHFTVLSLWNLTIIGEKGLNFIFCGCKKIV